VHRLVVSREHAPGLLAKPPPRFGGRQPPGGPLDEAGPDALFQRGERAGDCRGRPSQLAGGGGNCPQYIHLRDVRHTHAASAATEAFDGLDDGARAAISHADTFFVATSARVDEAAGGVDVSHRAGGEGFVRVEGETLVIPDYRGNRYFNTLGNLVAEPRAALLFVDFSRGDLLLVQGTTEIIWDGPEVRAHAGAERLWRVRVVRRFRRRGALGCAGPRVRRAEVASRASAALAVEAGDLERSHVDAVEATDVDCAHLHAVGAGAGGERMHAAHLAEQVVQVLLAELIIAERVGAARQLEPRGRREGPQRADPPVYSFASLISPPRRG
jgi:predicted pyridoxine 5'-phosphate oxidase superfamily flavin-nucleotide-binding protein